MAIKLKRAGRDGITHRIFEPLEFLEKMATLTPRPEINLTGATCVVPGCGEVAGVAAPCRDLPLDRL